MPIGRQGKLPVKYTLDVCTKSLTRAALRAGLQEVKTATFSCCLQDSKGVCLQNRHAGGHA